MRFGRIAGNDAINFRIYESFEQLDAADVRRFVKKFNAEKDPHRFHTYRELLIGAHLRRRGWNARYEQRVGVNTPDWAVVDQAGSVIEVVDVVTLHQRRVTESAISTAVAKHKLWTGWLTVPNGHIYSKLEAKASAYARLTESAQVPFTIAAFGEFTASIEPEDVREVCNVHAGGMFSACPFVSGVIFFRERAGQYRFSYFANPTADRASAMLAALAA
jgi:hypothetical protein